MQSRDEYREAREFPDRADDGACPISCVEGSDYRPARWMRSRANVATSCRRSPASRHRRASRICLAKTARSLHVRAERPAARNFGAVGGGLRSAASSLGGRPYGAGRMRGAIGTWSRHRDCRAVGVTPLKHGGTSLPSCTRDVSGRAVSVRAARTQPSTCFGRGSLQLTT